jgi:hypothetical protein
MIHLFCGDEVKDLSDHTTYRGSILKHARLANLPEAKTLHALHLPGK